MTTLQELQTSSLMQRCAKAAQKHDGRERDDVVAHRALAAFALYIVFGVLLGTFGIHLLWTAAVSPLLAAGWYWDTRPQRATRRAMRHGHQRLPDILRLRADMASYSARLSAVRSYAETEGAEPPTPGVIITFREEWQSLEDRSHELERELALAQIDDVVYRNAESLRLADTAARRLAGETFPATSASKNVATADVTFVGGHSKSEDLTRQAETYRANRQFWVGFVGFVLVVLGGLFCAKVDWALGAPVTLALLALVAWLNYGPWSAYGKLRAIYGDLLDRLASHAKEAEKCNEKIRAIRSYVALPGTAPPPPELMEEYRRQSAALNRHGARLEREVGLANAKWAYEKSALSSLPAFRDTRDVSDLVYLQGERLRISDEDMAEVLGDEPAPGEEAALTDAPMVAEVTAQTRHRGEEF